MAFTPMKMREAPATSAYARANERKIVFRAGTYVTGMPLLMALLGAGFGNINICCKSRAAEDTEIDPGGAVFRRS